MPLDGAAGGKGAVSHPSRAQREAARAADESTSSRRVRSSAKRSEQSRRARTGQRVADNVERFWHGIATGSGFPARDATSPDNANINMTTKVSCRRSQRIIVAAMALSSLVRSASQNSLARCASSLMLWILPSIILADAPIWARCKRMASLRFTVLAHIFLFESPAPPAIALPSWS